MEEKKSRQVRFMNQGWRFHLGDVPAPLANKHLAAYMYNKAGYARGAARGNFDDSDWRCVDLPHDWAIEGPFSPENHVNQGFLPRGIGWYRRHFRIEETSRDQCFQLQFDGVSVFCQVYVNGHLVERNFCGYTSFKVDITDLVTFGDALNVVSVRVDANYVEGWWYEGAGIYRDVRLIETAPVRIKEGSLFAKPQKVSDTNWRTGIEAELENRTSVSFTGRLICYIVDPFGQIVSQSEQPVSLEARQTRSFKSQIDVSSPQLWSLESPELYQLRASLVSDEMVVDHNSVRFGYRTIRFDADHGFFINDQHVKIKGTCNHQDHGGLGVAVPESIQRFRIRQLQSMGCNAYRCAHHPPSRELLDICDELGMLVLDENRSFGVSDEHFRQLRSMVLRDRNHPSVILWSICNEESIQGTENARKIAETMVSAVRNLDDSRPITAAISGGILNDNSMSDVIDVLSINYLLPQYDAFRAKRPKLPIVASETHCAHSTRGEYYTDKTKHRFSGYDEEHAPWGATARYTWKTIGLRDDVAGIFIWTGFEYRGEPSPHEWPSISSHWGLFDLCGFEKDTVYLHRAWWTSKPFIHLFPHWNWRTGETVRIRAYTNCDEIELFLNDQSLGRKPVDPIEMVEWGVGFVPGTLSAVGYRKSEVVARVAIETHSDPVSLGLELHPSANEIVWADGRSAIPVTIYATDAKNRRIANYMGNAVRLKISGPAKLIGVCNGDPTSLENPKGNSITLFNGLAQAIIQSTTEAGDIVIEAESGELGPAILNIKSQPASINSVPEVNRRYLINDWQMTQVTPDKPGLNLDFDTTDMNTFERVQPSSAGQSQWKTRGGYALYRVRLNLPKIVQSRGGKLIFSNIHGTAEVYLDHTLVASKPQAENGQMLIELPVTDRQKVLSLIIQSERAPAGIVGPVEIVAQEI